jgi:hypothetical protein
MTSPHQLLDMTILGLLLIIKHIYTQTGAFFAGDPKAPTPQEKKGIYSIPLGNAWMKGLIIQGGQAQCMRYSTHLILWDQHHIHLCCVHVPCEIVMNVCFTR